jgi:uncharacterized protein (DUF885 family)
MRGTAIIVAAAALASVACATRPAPDPDADFRAYADRFVREVMEFYPDAAIQAGYYASASRLAVPDDAFRRRELEFLAAHEAQLQRFHPEVLEPSLRADHGRIAGFLASTRWAQTGLRQWQWDASSYNVAPAFDLLLTTEYAPLEERLRTVLARLPAVPAYYAAALRNLERPTREHVQLAIQQNAGAAQVFGDGFARTVAESRLGESEKAALVQAAAAARSAIERYVAGLQELERTLTGDTARSFRLGRELYAEKYRYNIESSIPVEELVRRAQAMKSRLHGEMEVLARALWAKYFGRKKLPRDRLQLIAAVVDRVSEQHSRPEAFVDDVRRQIPELERFVREKDLLDQDPDKPLIVRETPPFNPTRGVAIASIDPPGPFNPGAPTYYNVNPMSDFSPERQKSFLREYNHWMVQILNIHEAVPGHYTQLLHSNRSPSLVKSLFGSGPMVEGWAVYAQRMMLENGWGGNAPELWLMLHKFDLRMLANVIIDHGVHVGGMTEAEALRIMTREAFQTETEARGKWRRVQLTSVQLTSYYAGYAEIMELREEQMRRLGPEFRLKEFHNRFLSYGSVPVSVIRELMGGHATAVAGRAAP